MADRSFSDTRVTGLQLRSPEGHARSIDVSTESDEVIESQVCHQGGGGERQSSIEDKPRVELGGGLINPTVRNANSTLEELAVGEVAMYLHEGGSGGDEARVALAALGGDLFVRPRAYCPALARFDSVSDGRSQ
jgi:hypothetical protein